MTDSEGSIEGTHASLVTSRFPATLAHLEYPTTCKYDIRKAEKGLTKLGMKKTKA